jgi:hypothetical protein
MPRKKSVSDTTLAKRIRETTEREVLAAFEAQKVYNREMHRRGAKDPDTFIKTTSFTHFINLIRFAHEVHLPDIELYIKTMVAAKRSPNTWSSDRSYRVFLQKMNTSTNASDAIRISAKELQDLADALETTVTELVRDMAVSEMLQLIRQRRISPWLVLNCRSFKKKIMESDVSEQDLISRVIDPDYWTIIMAQNRRAIQLAKQVCEILEI